MHLVGMEHVEVKWPASDPEAMAVFMNIHRGSALEVVCACGHRRRFSCRELCQLFPGAMAVTVRAWRERLVCRACGGRPGKAWQYTDPGAHVLAPADEARSTWVLRLAGMFAEHGIPLEPVLPMLQDPPPRYALEGVGRADLADALERAGHKLPGV